MKRFGNWKVLKKIRDTPCGELLSVRHETRDDEATLFACLADDQQLRSRFLLWGDSLAQWEHASITQVLESGLALGGVPFCAVEGDRVHTLGSILSEGRLHRLRAMRMLADLAEVMLAAHGKDITHGMLGSGTILVEDDRIKVADIGLWSMVLEPSGLASKALRQDNAPYLAPEQVSGQRADRRADVFAFGVLACEMLGGQHPYRSSTTGETLRALLHDGIPRLEDPPWSLPSPIAALITRCMRKDQADRIGGFEPIRAAFEQFLDPFLVVKNRIPETEQLEDIDELERAALPAPSFEPEVDPAPLAATIPAASADPIAPPAVGESPTPQESAAELPPPEPPARSSVDAFRGAVTQPIRPVSGGWPEPEEPEEPEEPTVEDLEPSSGSEAPVAPLEDSPPADEAASDHELWEEGLSSLPSGDGDPAEEASTDSGKVPPPKVDEPSESVSSPEPVDVPETEAEPAERVEVEQEEVASFAEPEPAADVDEQAPTAVAASGRWIWGLIAASVVVVLAVYALLQRDTSEPVTQVETAPVAAAEDLATGRRLQAAGVALERGDRERAIEAVLMVLEDQPDREEAIGILGRIVEASLRATDEARAGAEAAGANDLVPVIVTQCEEKVAEAQELLDDGDWEAGVRALESAGELYRLAAKQAELFAKPVRGEDAARERELLLAAEEGDENAMAELLESGDGTWGEGERKALRLAITLEHSEVVRALIEDLPEEPDLGQLLVEAALDGKPELVVVLLDLGADIEARDPLGRTPLLQAAADGHPLTAGVLLERGADSRARDDLGRSARDLALKGGHPQVVETLDSHEQN